jgi:hypothetical protein
MNCREAQSQLYAERDAALDSTQRTALEGHLAHCGNCQRVRDDLAAAFTTWRTGVNQSKIPDPEREWHAVRRRIRGGADIGATQTKRPGWRLFTWLAVPVAAAAAVAMALFTPPQTSQTIQSANAVAASAARGNSVDVAGAKATTVVFVDDKSGWLFVLASDPAPKQG